MAIHVKLFARLAEDAGFREKDIPLPESATVTGVWKAVMDTPAPPDHLLCALNFEYVQADTPVAEGDEVAFFPPVTGG
ncbi:MAG: MoaD/ThiS family protein [Gammaproteobacteria bacterium]|nr:MoaD/ThiS family protein [Gammaproteobacteria bacterium]